MRKGFFASVAALAASASVSLGQYPPASPAMPSGYPSQIIPGPLPSALPPATAMPSNGLVPGTDSFSGYGGGVPGGYPGGGVMPAAGCENCGPGGPGGPGGHGGHGFGDGMDGPPKHRSFGQGEQVHKAAGGPDHMWLDLEWLIWYLRPMPVPYPLVVIGPPASNGLLGQPGVQTVYGDKNINYENPRNAFRLSGGWWFDSCQKWGFEASGFINEGTAQQADFYATRDGRHLLARPFINALTGLTDSYIVGYGVPPYDTSGAVGFDGEIHVANKIQFGGAEANILRGLVYCDRFKLNLLCGIRYMDIDESMDIYSLTVDPNGALDPIGNPNITSVHDSFNTRNQFLGLNLGFESSIRRGRWFLDTTGKIALGNVYQQLHVYGSTQQLANDVYTFNSGGLLALDTNTIDVTKNDFAILPELTLKVGYNLTQRISVYVGYTALYLSKVMRPGDQIDPFVNPVYVPSSSQYPGNFGPLVPANSFNRSDFIAQGATLGFSIKY